MGERYRSYGAFLKETYGQKVYRVGVDGLFGCPNRRSDGSGGCTYCDGTGSKAAYQRQEESSFNHLSIFNDQVSQDVLWHNSSIEERCSSIARQIEKGSEFVHRRYHANLLSLYFQAWTNTFGTVETLRKLYDSALSCGSFTELIVSTRPDCIDHEKAELLASYQGKVQKVWVELGLQSADDRTLASINRGHDSHCYLQAAKLLHEEGVLVCTHVILGLPGESYEQFSHTAALLNEAGSEAVKIHNLDICGGTALLDDFLQGEMGVPSMKRHIEACIFFLRRLREDMVIQRFLCETPLHRLAAPRDFGDKNNFLLSLEGEMQRRNVFQGDLYGQD
ncbi:MAG: TIGR01212 family radical SAM protein [Sphaerochaetaceae bacterium]